MKELIKEELIKEFPLKDDVVLDKEIRRIVEATIDFFESEYRQREEQSNGLNKARNEIKKNIERAKENFRKNNTKSKEERIEFARKILTQVLELSALSVRENSANSISSIDMSIITRIFSKGEFGKPLRKMLFHIYGIGVVDKIKAFYASCQKNFLGAAIISLNPDLFPLEIPINMEILREIINNKKCLTIAEITEITEFDIKKIEGKIRTKNSKKHQRDIPSFSF